MTSFPKGLVTDTIGVDGALLEMNDCWMDRTGEIRKRGGKTALGVVTTDMEDISKQIWHPSIALGSGRLCAVYLYNAASEVSRLYTKSVTGESGVWSAIPARVDSTGATPTGAGYGGAEVDNMVPHDDEIVVPFGLSADAPARWSGSTKASYRTGTVATTDGSKVVTGTGTTWSGNVEAGEYLWVTGHSGLKQRSFKIMRVLTNTTLEVDQAPNVSVSGQAYAINAAGRMSCQSGIFCDTSGAETNFPVAESFAGYQGRIFCGSTREPDGTGYKWWRSRLRWSALPHESAGKFLGIDYWQPDAYIDVGASGSGEILALIATDSELLIFKSSSVYALRGDVASDGTYIGARTDLVSDGLTIATTENIASSRIGVIAAAYDDVYVYSGGRFASLTEGRVRSTYLEFVAATRTAGRRVSATSTRIIIQGYDTSAGNTRTLVYDLRQRTWSTQSCDLFNSIIDEGAGNYAIETGIRVPTTAAPVTAQEYNWSADYATTNKNDGWSAATTPRMSITTHPINVGLSPLATGRPKEVWLNGYITDAASDNPVLGVTLLQGRKGTTTGTGSALTVGSVAEGTVDKTARLNVNGAFDDAASAIRIRILQANAASDARLYGVSLMYDVDRDNANG